jgi:hypothetical protein
MNENVRGSFDSDASASARWGSSSPSGSAAHQAISGSF